MFPPHCLMHFKQIGLGLKRVNVKFSSTSSQISDSLSLVKTSQEWKYHLKNFHVNRNVMMRRSFCSNANDKLKSTNVQELLDNAAGFENEVVEGNDAWSTSPYPKGAYNPRLQSNRALRPRVDPRETSIILFPGEGSQYVGMVERFLKFPGVRDIFLTANDILNYDILSLCLKGPKSKLDETKYAQVAVFVCSFAAFEKLREERPSSVDNCIAAAGFGVGELTALTFAGAISYERGIRLAQLRGEAMQIASEMEPSGMMTVIYNHSTKLHEVLEQARAHGIEKGIEAPLCEVANYLFPHCKVIAGHNECLDYIEKNFKKLNLERVRRLQMKGAHNTRMMQPAAQTFKQYLLKSNLNDPVIAVHCSSDGRVYRGAKDVLQKLPHQISKPIKWEQMLHILYERPDGQHFPQTFECGPGSTLKTILKMVNAKAYDSCETVFETKYKC